MSSSSRPGGTHSHDERRSGVSVASRPPQPVLQTPIPPRKRRRPARMLVPLFLVGCFLFLAVAITSGAVSEASGLQLFQPHARIRLTLNVKVVHFPISVLVTSQDAHPASSIHIHQLTGKSPYKRVSTPATGIQQAQTARGTLSFYNQSSSWQSVPAGTNFTGRDGAVVSIDTQAHVPPWTPDGGMGSTAVSAHATTSGAAGNIAINDITSCCGSNGLLIKNSTPFSGGKDAASVVKAQDIEKAEASLLPSQQQAAMQALRVQTSSDDQPLNAPTCTSAVQSDHQVGSSASAVVVAVGVSCQEQTYSRQEVKHQVSATFTTSPEVQGLGAGYLLQGQPTLDMTLAHVTRASQDTVSITVPTRGTFVYQLNAQTIRQISTKLAGTTISNAQTLLARLPGVSSFDIQVTGGWNSTALPTDESSIDIIEVSSMK